MVVVVVGGTGGDEIRAMAIGDHLLARRAERVEAGHPIFDAASYE